MRRSRWLILALIVAIVIAIAATYTSRKATLAKDAPAPPPKLENQLDGRANDWVYTQSDGERPKVTVRAKSIRQVKAPSVMELDGVELDLYNKDGSRFDLVRSAKAQFDIAAKSLYADGEVEISMDMPAANPPGNGEPSGRIVKIHSSGVRFASDTGKAFTDRAATFEFDQGGGSAVGAEYDPQTRQLLLRSQVSLDWRGKGTDSRPMHIETGVAVYNEAEARVLLMPWAKLTRDTLHTESSGPAEVKLDHGEIRQVDAQSAHGTQSDPDRRVDFGADRLTLAFGKSSIIEHIHGQQNGKLVSTSKSVRTIITADQLDLDFSTASKESSLTAAVAQGKSVAEADPVPQPGEAAADTRILRSEVIRLKMRPGGREIDAVETDGAGTIDFLPNRPGQPKRFMKGDKIWIAYGQENRVKSILSQNVTTRTDKPGEATPLLTRSKALLAQFDPKTSELTQLDQNVDFHYEEGDRRATADHAILEQQKDLMTLLGSARVWDSTGSSSADRIVMNQKSGDFNADGHVATTRLPDQKESSSSGMLSDSDVLQARAQRMTSKDKNRKIHYEGSAIAWQSANRVEADRIDIDRERQSFEAHGKVISQFMDKTKETAAANKNQPPPIFTVVRAPDLVYTDQSRLAHYLGGATLTRPDLTVNGKEIRAFLKDSDADSTLDKAIADGTVKIVSTADARTRTGTSEHAEYYADDQKVILNGGDPLFVDSMKGQTRGKELTWFANDDRLLVNGQASRPADSLLRKKN